MKREGKGNWRVGMHIPMLGGIVRKGCCFSIFFCGCKLLKSLHISFSDAKIQRKYISREEINVKCSFQRKDATE